MFLMPRRGKMLVAPDEIRGMKTKNVFKPWRGDILMNREQNPEWSVATKDAQGTKAGKK
jgi:hypothetical protein